jgi:hypothetical protein
LARHTLGGGAADALAALIERTRTRLARTLARPGVASSCYEAG